MKLKDAMDAQGIFYDYDKVSQRFMGNEALLLKFVKKFAADPSYNTTMEAWNQRNYESLESGAHTLKGVCANLGFDELSGNSKEVVDAIRRREYDKLEGYMEILVEGYEKVIAGIALLD